jgi:hypothetical protein
VAGLAGGVLVSTIHAPPVAQPQIQAGRLLQFDCPSDIPEAFSEGPRSCRRLEVVNTGNGEGTAMCVLVNDHRGAIARFPDTQGFHHAITLGSGQTGSLLVAVEGEQAKHDAMMGSCGIPPDEG